jgi:hypothetical protein
VQSVFSCSVLVLANIHSACRLPDPRHIAVTNRERVPGWLSDGHGTIHCN